MRHGLTSTRAASGETFQLFLAQELRRGVRVFGNVRFLLSILFAASSSLTIAADQFETEILPILDRTCVDCHEPGLSKGGVPFLEAETASQIGTMRHVWRSVASQLRNRTMPPPDKPQPTDEERELVATWIEDHLRESALRMKPYAGQVMARRLNRLEFDLTIRDLFGVDLKFSETFPIDSGTGEGFNNSGESLFLPPMLLERYLESAQQVVDAAILSRPFEKVIAAEKMRQENGESIALVPIYRDASYRTIVEGSIQGKNVPQVELKVDGLPVHRFRPKLEDGRFRQLLDLKLNRGVHALSVLPSESSLIKLSRITVRQFEEKSPTSDDLARHKRLAGIEFGKNPEFPAMLARKQLAKFLPLAFRRPVTEAEISRYLTLFGRGMKRGDPYEEAIKLALRGALVSPEFLFRLEPIPKSVEPLPLGDYEIATRLAYFLWARMPDDRLRDMAEQGRLQNQKVLLAETRRMLKDPKSATFVQSFAGQWLGTKDVGGRKAPTANDVQEFYKPEIAADMRQEVTEYVRYLVRGNRSILELVDSDYSFVTGRLAKFYELPNSGKLKTKEFQRIDQIGQQRGGLLGMGAVLALTSHHKKTSPVLRGAWVFDTLLGAPVPPPPADVPELVTDKVDVETGKKRKLTDREQLDAHREAESCQACHRLIDPIGFGLQNFDWVGRWRAKEHGKSVDASGILPSGEEFDGPAALKKVLIQTRTEEMTRNLTRKMLGYALGRALQDGDDGTIEQITQKLSREDYGMRTLIEEVVLSVPFRQHQLIESDAKRD